MSLRDADLEWKRQPGTAGMPISVTHRGTGKSVAFDKGRHGLATRGVRKKVPLHKRAQADMLTELELLLTRA